MQINVYGTKVCPNCKVVVNYLEDKEIEYTYELIGDDVTVEEMNRILGRLPRTVPIILMNDNEVTFDALKKRLNQNEILAAGVESLQGLEL